MGLQGCGGMGVWGLRDKEQRLTHPPPIKCSKLSSYYSKSAYLDFTAEHLESQETFFAPNEKLSKSI